MQFTLYNNIFFTYVVVINYTYVYVCMYVITQVEYFTVQLCDVLFIEYYVLFSVTF